MEYIIDGTGSRRSVDAGAQCHQTSRPRARRSPQVSCVRTERCPSRSETIKLRLICYRGRLAPHHEPFTPE